MDDFHGCGPEEAAAACLAKMRTVFDLKATEVFLEGRDSHLRRDRLRMKNSTMIRGSVEEGFDDFFNLPVRPTAVVVFNDALATAFLHACWQRQVRVPEDVSVATFNNPPATAYTIPPLTVVDIPSQALVDHAVKQLLEMVEQDQPDMYEPVILPVTLKIRQSTGPADAGSH